MRCYLVEMLRAMKEDAASNEEAIASIEKALEIEIRVRNGAERLSQTYKDGPRIYLESAMKQLEVAEAKIGFLRNQLARLKHAGVSVEHPKRTGILCLKKLMKNVCMFGILVS